MRLLPCRQPQKLSPLLVDASHARPFCRESHNHQLQERRVGQMHHRQRRLLYPHSTHRLRMQWGDTAHETSQRARMFRGGTNTHAKRCAMICTGTGGWGCLPLRSEFRRQLPSRSKHVVTQLRDTSINSGMGPCQRYRHPQQQQYFQHNRCWTPGVQKSLLLLTCPPTSSTGSRRWGHGSILSLGGVSSRHTRATSRSSST